MRHRGFGAIAGPRGDAGASQRRINGSSFQWPLEEDQHLPYRGVNARENMHEVSVSLPMDPRCQNIANCTVTIVQTADRDGFAGQGTHSWA